MKKVWLAILIILGISFSYFAQAQEKSPAEGITVSPPLFDLSLVPGATTTYQIKLNNTTDSPLTLYASAADFISAGETGQPTFFEATQENFKYSMSSWISFETKEITLAPKVDTLFTFRITPPQDAGPGGHYGVVFLATKPPESEKNISQVALSSRIGSLLLVRIPGEIEENGSLLDFSAKKFFFSPPVNFSTLIQNNGNIHFKPEGDIALKNLFGSEINRLNFNTTNGNVLPESKRRFDVKWSPPLSPFWKIPVGRFTADLRLTYGQGQQTMGQKINFWIIPWWFIVTVTFIIFVIIALIWRKRKKAKKNKPAENPLQQ